MVGQTISHYEIVEKLGVGGMGVVYKARDLKLDRFAALKFLPHALSTDEDHKHRFIHEAKAASALDHPNIGTIYEIDETPDGQMFIAMAYYGGETLKKKIQQGPLPLPAALDFAAQVAQGLARAHRQKIVHRDIKPANLMVTDDGLVKIVDFGLAHFDAATKLTKAGSSLGTPAYMSPEQAQRQPVDHRTDVWSFGVVVYEMLTGQTPFHGAAEGAVVYSILNEEPEPLTARRTGVPMDLERLVTKCLAKDAEERYQHMDDLMVDLRALQRQLDFAITPAPVRRAPAASAGKPAVSPTQGWRLSLNWLWPGIAAALILAWWLDRSRERTVERPPEYKLTQLTRDSGYTAQPALSPDGKLVAYVSDRAGEDNLDVWVQQTTGGEPIRLTRTEFNETAPAFSADGGQIVYTVGGGDGRGGIYIMPALGGNPRRIADRGVGPAFSPDGQWVAYHVGHQNSSSSIYIVAAMGGQPRRLEMDASWAAWPLWSPDGSHLLFLGSPEPMPGDGGQSIDWWLAPVGGGRAVNLRAREVFRDAGLAFDRLRNYGAWLAQGDRILFAAFLGDSRNLWQVSVSWKDGRIGALHRLTSGTGEWQPSAALDGRIAFASPAFDSDIWSLPIDADEPRPLGPPERVVAGASSAFYPTVSDDGKKLVFISNRSGNNDVWLKDMETGKEIPVTLNPAGESRAAISPDGTRVAFIRRENEVNNLYASEVGQGAEKRLVEGIGNLMDWAPDGKRIVYWMSGQRIQFESVNVDTGEKIGTIQHPNYDVHDARFSPDAKWLSFKLMIDPPRVESIFISPVREGAAAEQNEWIRITEGHREERNWWSRDGSVLYFLSQRDGFSCIWAQRLDPMTKTPSGPPVEIRHFHGPRRSLNTNRLGYGMLKDRLYMPISEQTANIWLAEPLGPQ